MTDMPVLQTANLLKEAYVSSAPSRLMFFGKCKP